MNTNENLEQKREDALAVVKWGVTLMKISVALFFITLFYFYATGYLNRVYISDIAKPLVIEALMFVPGLVVVFIGLLKERESL